MARRVRLVRRKNQGTGELPMGEWIPAHAVKFNTDGTTSLMTEGPHRATNRGRRNESVEEGFWTGTGRRRKFHPIRASADYDPEAVGERYQYAPQRKKAKAKKRRR